MRDLVFTLRVRLFKNEPMIMIRAYDRQTFDGPWSLDVEVKQGGKVIFPLGSIWCGGARFGSASQDGIEAKELVLSLVAMKPGDTDADYFTDYTQEQLDWASHNGESLSCEREYRYCDENDNTKRSK